MTTLARSLEAYKQWYNSVVATEADRFEKFQYHVEKQLHGLSLQGKRILEVGCGQGAVSLYVALFGGTTQVVALDEAAGEGSPVGVTKVLKDAVQRWGITNLTVVDLDIMKNTLLDGSFDIIIANNALHHVVDSGLISRNEAAAAEYVRLFKELRRLLVPGGMLSIWEYSRIQFWRWSPVKLKRKNIEWQIHPTLAEWRCVIKRAGFQGVHLCYDSPYKVRRYERLVGNPIVMFFLGARFILTARNPSANGSTK